MTKKYCTGKICLVQTAKHQVSFLICFSEDEFALPRLSKQAQREITQQLIKDGYNLDMEPDDEDLDLIPPRPLNDRCVCCQTPFVWDSRCSIQ